VPGSSFWLRFTGGLCRDFLAFFVKTGREFLDHVNLEQRNQIIQAMTRDESFLERGCQVCRRGQRQRGSGNVVLDGDIEGGCPVVTECQRENNSIISEAADFQ
jgi:hypothetical protein